MRLRREPEEPVITPWAGMVYCLRCGRRWRSPDRKLRRICYECSNANSMVGPILRQTQSGLHFKYSHIGGGH